MKASRRGAACECGASHPSRPQAAREGWLATGPQHRRVWVCPSCLERLRVQREAERERLNRIRDDATDPAIMSAFLPFLFPPASWRR